VTNELRNKYGLADFDIPAKNIHILPENEWVNIFGEDNGGDGVYSPSGQGILVEDDSEMKIYFAKKLLHEILHAKAYQAIQVIGEENPKLRQYRDGIVVHSRDGEVIYFANFYEALTEELAKKYLKQLLDNPVFKNEVEDSSKIMQESSGTKDDSGEPLFNDETFYVYEGEDEKGPWLRTHEFTYQRPRKILNTLIDKLYERNEDKFESREEVFELFEKGMITGNILPLGRTIDRTFGKGIFRKIGELDENLDELEEFVNSL
ncbi:MAG: hypothetical protein R3251_04275, partial [Candidatus Spechtbacterales bacterium]|nr:hypothetical protein [Candidatus Spechtbacterales bacterium]